MFSLDSTKVIVGLLIFWPITIFAFQAEIDVEGYDFWSPGMIAPEYEAVLEKFEKKFSPIYATHGGSLKLMVQKNIYLGDVRELGDGVMAVKINGWADVVKDNWVVGLRASLKQYYPVSLESLYFLICHESGHFLGGWPLKPEGPEARLTAEGQADYYAATKCLRIMFQDEDNFRVLQLLPAFPVVQTTCRAHWSDEKDALICQRSAMTAYHFLNISLSGNLPTLVNFGTPSTEQVEEIQTAHPNEQCRLDTFLQGAICQAPSNVEFDTSDWVKGSCAKKNNDTFGFRPSCWFVEPPAIGTDL